MEKIDRKTLRRIRDHKCSSSAINIADLELVSLLRPGEEYLPLEEVLSRAKELKALGEEVAERLFERKKEIPEEWGRYGLLFLGTIYEADTEDKEIYTPIIRAALCPQKENSLLWEWDYNLCDLITTLYFSARWQLSNFRIVCLHAQSKSPSTEKFQIDSYRKSFQN